MTDHKLKLTKKEIENERLRLWRKMIDEQQVQFENEEERVEARWKAIFVKCFIDDAQRRAEERFAECKATYNFFEDSPIVAAEKELAVLQRCRR